MKFFGKKAARLRVQIGMDLKRCSSCQSFTRPCEIDGNPAIFHRWCEVENGILQLNAFVKPQDKKQLLRDFEQTRTIPAGCTLEKLKDVAALVEWPDGTVSKVNPKFIKFLDIQQPSSSNETKETKSQEEKQ